MNQANGAAERKDSGAEMLMKRFDRHPVRDELRDVRARAAERLKEIREEAADIEEMLGIRLERPSLTSIPVKGGAAGPGHRVDITSPAVKVNVSGDAEPDRVAAVVRRSLERAARVVAPPPPTRRLKPVPQTGRRRPGPRGPRAESFTAQVAGYLKAHPTATARAIAKAIYADVTRVSKTLNTLKVAGRAKSSGKRPQLLWRAA